MSGLFSNMGNTHASNKGFQHCNCLSAGQKKAYPSDALWVYILEINEFNERVGVFYKSFPPFLKGLFNCQFLLINRQDKH